MNEETPYDSPPSAGQQRAADQLKTLRYWLATEDIYTSTYVREWLERTPLEEAAGILAGIAEYAQPEPHSFWYMFSRGFTMMFTTSEIISDRSPAGRKAGIRAALLLADMDDPNCLPPLARAFETQAFWEGKYQEAIEEALIRFLSDADGRPDIAPFAADINNLALRIWQSGGGRKELSPRRANLLIAALHCLKGIAGESEIVLLSLLLRLIAATRTSTPNRARVQEAAIALLESAPEMEK
jgi:hypothetical protein